MSRVKPNNVAMSSVAIPGKTLKVGQNSHAITVDADYGCWDSVSDKAVKVEDTNLKDPN